MTERPSHEIQIEELKRAEKINRVLFRITNAVSVTSDLHQLYASIHQTLSQVIDGTNFFIALYDSEKRTLGFPYYRDEKDIELLASVSEQIALAIDRKRTEDERDALIAELKKTLAEVKTLKGIIPICASCKKIRDDKGYWNQVEAYIQAHSEAEFSHSICNDCVKKLYPDLGLHKESSTPQP